MAAAPLVPAECDLRNFQFMPFDVRRLLASETWILGNGDERAAAITLWMESWHQIPAGSLPNNDRMLAHLSQAGTKWKRVKAHAMRGWIEASDGRLYHPTVAEKALEAWIEKLSNSISGAAGNAKRWGVDVDIDEPRQQFIEAVYMLRNIAPQSPALKKRIVATIAAASPPDHKNDRPPIPPQSPPLSPSDRKGQGQGQGYIKEEAAATPPPRARVHTREAGDDSPPPLSDPEISDHIPDEAPKRATQIAVLLRRNGACQNTHSGSKGIAELVEQQATDAQVLTALETAKQRRKDTGSSQPVTAAYLLPIVRDLQQDPPAAAAKPKHDVWWTSNAGIDRKGRELGLFARPTEDYPSFKDRIFDEIRRREQGGEA